MESTLENDNLDNDKSILETHWENFKLFCNELYELLLDDLNNFIYFLTANKQYIIYSIFLVILTQIVSINSLGNSARQYCKSTSIQDGGAGNILVKQMTSKNAKSHLKNMSTNQKKDIFKKGMELQKTAKTEKLLTKKSEFEINKDRISFFEKMKQKFQPGGWFGRFGALGPVFGNLEAIMDSVKWIFAIMVVIAIIIGALSLPVIIFMVVTYFVIKSLMKKFTVL
jgi:hypothetical protein